MEAPAATGGPLSFSVAAIDLRMLIKRLKPAFPDRREASRTRLVVKVSPDHVTLALPGGEVGTVAKSSATFQAEVPFAEIHWLAKETFRDGEYLTFAFAPGVMTFRGASVQSSDIYVRHSDEAPAPAPGKPLVTEPMAGALGLPLVAAYHTLKQYPAGTFTGNAHLQAAAREIDGILKRADKLLRPLGIGRADLTAILDRRGPAAIQSDDRSRP